MASFTPGFTFVNGTQVRPQDLNNLIDQASLTGLGVSNFGGGTAGCIFYGNTSPPLQRGILWYDTTAGSEGLKVAHVSASRASFSRWLYMTPRREGVFWSDSAVSLGFPLFINRPGFRVLGHHWAVFDGMIYQRAWLYDSSSGANPLMVIPTESTAGCGPVVCMWAGLGKAEFSNSPLAAASFVFTTYTAPNHMQDSNQAIPARKHIQGVNQRAGTDSAYHDGVILWSGSPAIEDLTP